MKKILNNAFIDFLQANLLLVPVAAFITVGLDIDNYTDIEEFFAVLFFSNIAYASFSILGKAIVPLWEYLATKKIK